MSVEVIAQYAMNGAMLGMMYALVAVGFTLFFGVLDIIQFSHGDVVAAGAFAGLAAWTVSAGLGLSSPGALLIAATHLLITRTRLGLAIRAVAQDEETARTMGIDFRKVVLVTFALGSALAAFAGVMDGLYYNEVFFGMGLLLGVIGFAAAILGGLGNLYGAIVGGFLFAALQTVGAVALPFASAYKDVFAFGVVIVLMALRPTGLIGERQ